MLKLAFKAFDNGSGQVSYREFVKALEKYGLTACQGVRGLFDRYNTSVGSDALSYAEFIRGLFGGVKPPAPARSERSVWAIAEQLRDTPTARWASSSEDLSPPRRAVRVVSIANEQRQQPPLKWRRGPSGPSPLSITEP